MAVGVSAPAAVARLCINQRNRTVSNNSTARGIAPPIYSNCSAFCPKTPLKNNNNFSNSVVVVLREEGKEKNNNNNNGFQKLWIIGLRPGELCQNLADLHGDARVTEVVARAGTAKEPAAWVRRALENNFQWPKPSVRTCSSSTNAVEIYHRLAAEIRVDLLQRLLVRHQSNAEARGKVQAVIDGGEPSERLAKAVLEMRRNR